ncbi:Holliday junction resolvase-like protein [Treponema brennaborense]|uniref:Holliday junction resolvase-like protein n=1 Tax=Treponema brennaborense (strain DSM 12168 / CIP 105900 / DD5/3) TaxID=906968 RepID=F4LPU4_TREBD|nr:Holliday junction resolvase-like protein [Treponema brennaborense]AEE16036.1 Holliday junction resolvase-like protein [Treponema brennaborense DSM 12168]
MNSMIRFAAALSGRELLFLTLSVFGFILVCAFCVAVGIRIGRLGSDRRIRSERRDAVRRSKSVVTGLVSEQLAPFLPGFPCNPADVRFVGKPVDFIGFCSDSGGDRVEEVLFIEVKTGSGSLSARERSVKQAVEAGRVRYIEYRIG